MATLEGMMEKEWRRDRRKRNNPMMERQPFRVSPPRRIDEAQKTVIRPPVNMPDNAVLSELNEIKQMLKDLTEAVADLKFTVIRKYMQRSYAESALEKRKEGDRIRQRKHKLKMEKRK